MTDSSINQALARKARSEQILNRLKLPFDASLPPLPGEGEVFERTPPVILKRLFSLIVVALKAEGLESEILAGLIDSFGLHEALSEEEKQFIANTEADGELREQMAWRLESAWLLWWALGFVEALTSPQKQVPMTDVVGLIQNRDAKQLLEAARPRPLSELLDEADLFYRLHAAIGQWEGRKRKVPGNYDPGVILERHLALQWLVDPARPEWDAVLAEPAREA